MTIQKTHTATLKRLDFRSPVDIIVPFHGQYDKVAKLVESIFRYTYSNVYNLILVDDASPNADFISECTKIKTQEPLKVTCVRCREQKGFGGAMEAGFNKGTNPWCVFLHSDCSIETVNWLQSLGETALALKEQGVRMVAPRTNNPLNGDPRQKGEKDEQAEHVILEDEHLSMYAFIIHRELISRVGGFIKPYEFGWYEDEEFAYRMKHYGFKQAISGTSWIHHQGEATYKAIWQKNPDVMKVMEANRECCLADMRSLRKKS